MYQWVPLRQLSGLNMKVRPSLTLVCLKTIESSCQGCGFLLHYVFPYTAQAKKTSRSHFFFLHRPQNFQKIVNISKRMIFWTRTQFKEQERGLRKVQQTNSGV